MLGLTKHFQRRRRMTRLTGEIISATKSDESAVDAVVNRAELFSGVQARIAAKQRQHAVDSGRVARLFAPRLIPAAIAALILLAGALTIFRQITETPIRNTTTADHSRRLPSLPESPATELAEAEDRTGQTTPRRRKLRRPAIRRTEVVSDFIPLTYLAESTAIESGLIVRVRVSRSMLTKMGLPVNAEISDETVLADVAMGDDGLARAIRFVN